MFKIYKYLLVGLFLFWVLCVLFLSVDGDEAFAIEDSAKMTCEGVKVTEFMPKPSDGNEWVEIYNDNGFDIDVKGCFISDISSGTNFYEIKDNVYIKSGTYYVFYTNKSIGLNDSSSDGVRFLAAKGSPPIFETEKYPMPTQTDQSYAYKKEESSWIWTNILTPGSPNIFASDDPAPNDEDDESEVGFHNSCDGIMITEIMPSPADTDTDNEWIEVYNSNGETVDLGGCTLGDKLKAGSTKKYTIPTGTQVVSGGYVKFMRPVTKITLNNDSDGVVLLSSDGVLVFDTGLYVDAQENLSYAYHEGQWFWTSTPTPEAANIITEPPAKTSKKVSSSTKKKAVVKPPKSTNKSAKKSSEDSSAVLGANSGDGVTAQGKVSDKMMGYVLVGLSAVLLVGYVVWINKDFIYEKTIKKIRRNS